MTKSYAEKLRDPRWQEKRLRVMDRAGFSCEWCGSNETTLHVHHGYYERGFEPWDYSDDTLYCLCADCHAEVHNLKNVAHKEVARIHPKYLSQLTRELVRFRDRVEAREVPRRDIEWCELSLF